MKSAHDMFEELGYEYSECDRGCGITVDYWIGKDTDDWKHICFYRRHFYAEENCAGMYVDMSTFKAIQKQLEELGWLDD